MTECNVHDWSFCFFFHFFIFSLVNKQMSDQETDAPMTDVRTTSRRQHLCGHGMCKSMGKMATWTLHYTDGMRWACDDCKEDADEEWKEVLEQYESGPPTCYKIDEV